MQAQHIRLLIESLLQLNGCLDNNTYDLVKEYLSGIYARDGMSMDQLFDSTEKVNSAAINELFLVNNNRLFKITIDQLT